MSPAQSPTPKAPSAHQTTPTPNYSTLSEKSQAKSPKNSTTPLITVTNLTKSYKRKKTVKNISFSINPGEIFGILGPNGAGKTTTLEMMETLRPITSGQVLIDGIDVTKHPKQIKSIIGIQLQSTSFVEKLTLTEQLEMFASLYGLKIDPLALLKKVQLADKSTAYVEHLSGGQKQRFAIAAALVNRPKVLFLDEPTTGLDPQSRRNLWELIQSIRKSGLTIILTTHYMDEAEILCDRLAIMDSGEIIVIDTPENLIQDLLKRGFKKPQIVEQANLEDVFIDLTGKDIRD